MRKQMKMLLIKSVEKAAAAGLWKPMFPIIERYLKKLIIEEESKELFSEREREDRFYAALGLIKAVLLAYKNGSKAVKEHIRRNFENAVVHYEEKQDKIQAYKEKYGEEPPYFLTISPTAICNLNCPDCYAKSTPKTQISLTADEVDWLLKANKEEWGNWFVVISGGEPFMWRDGDIDLIEMAKRHQDQFFLVYTNGTLINEKTAKRLAEVGNITPAISVEGMREKTDARRGKGVFDKILAAMRRLREHGVPFGISVTATPDNYREILSDEFLDFFFNEMGAYYMWVFQYMPIGRGITVLRQVSPGARFWMWKTMHEQIRKRKVFIGDFWNAGTFSHGCIAAARGGGYFYIDWKGNIYPCVFVPFYKDNIRDIRAKGLSLSDAINSDFFKAIRDWQHSYSYFVPADKKGNEILPCFIRDNHKVAHEVFVKYNAKAYDEESQQIILDPLYYEQMLKYNEECRKIFDPIWEKLYRPAEVKEKEVSLA